MSVDHEDHLHLLVCIDRLNSAWRTLNCIEANRGNALVGPAFRYALVEYATVFKRSDGLLKKRRFLPEACVPPEHLVLHQRIISARDQVHAHADLNVLDARLDVQYVDGDKYVSHIQNYIHGLEELENLPQVIALVEGVMDNVYVMHRASKDTIEPDDSSNP